MNQQPPASAPAMTVDIALANAARLLYQAEMELTNLPLMDQLDNLAGSWINVAHLLAERG